MRAFALFLFIIFVLIAGCNLSTPISPGLLATFHSDLEGTHNCTKCHTLGKKVSDENCLNCHTEIKTRRDNKTGYHSSKEVGQKKCVSCHSDHHGLNFEIIHFDTLKFDHDLTGYKLEGSHESKNCTQCHQQAHITSKELKKKSSTYLGLDQTCLTCHDDFHQNTLSQKCAECHDFNKFRPVTKFNHDDANYKLIGKHSNIDCEKCHEKTLMNGVEYQRFTGLNYTNCNQCQEDIHQNKFGQDCASCHSEESFLKIKDLQKFNHSLTGYKLEGKHVTVDCYDCHDRNCTNDMAHAKCLDCHKDHHKGIFKTNNRVRDCESCHDIEGFKVPKYSIEQHNASSFPLSGSHVATPCLSCHKKTDEWKFRKIGKICSDCHKDIHESYISTKYYPGKNCLECHVSSEWAMVSFDHSKTSFQLTGAHAKQTCAACHYEGEQGSRTQKFATLEGSCTSCHTDIHNGQFLENGNTDCLRCHAFNDWQASKFSHDNANFKLDGKHKGVDCIKCHIEVRENSVSYVQYKLTTYRCEDCH
ncbi:MAG: cytochrome C [Bacteroidales bacterium]|jgi:nitrate/TMAO reductase-like tetraheme cytochrome c subunit|nr:cytochrome C [Bacteroidales bacterium]